ncbi:small integral membrane protein 20 isoform X2 [Mesoplodon densirostris]|uniref:small integral membrane protein 20 isoform X2 n=2 Tax=Mesoplodon densirostris TaxID=48708 RepID=UPI0028DB5FF3|nr:small integral membrane protein 20 isoform X2 [Mesoplodon densirostris]
MTSNLRTALIFGGFISLIGAAFYPIYFRPLMRLEEYHGETEAQRGCSTCPRTHSYGRAKRASGQRRLLEREDNP